MIYLSFCVKIFWNSPTIVATHLFQPEIALRSDSHPINSHNITKSIINLQNVTKSPNLQNANKFPIIDEK